MRLAFAAAGPGIFQLFYRLVVFEEFLSNMAFRA
jgi:hypothetical protein